jgi:hypothetical protein
MATLPAESEQPALRLLTTNCPKSTVEVPSPDWALPSALAINKYSRFTEQERPGLALFYFAFGPA